jgi:hypothetical protein
MRRAALLLAAAASLGADAVVGPGSYCPLPKGDEPPACLAPAEQQYQGFFAGLAQGDLDDAALTGVEGDLGGERRYQALSSLAYAYYVLSRRAAAGPVPDPEITARLERWNALLGDTYRASDPAFRNTLREAAGDLQRNAPAVRLRCKDAEGREVECQSTDAVVQAMTDVRDQTGLRGAMARLIGRLLGSE